MKIVFTGGGTGGHVIPNVAVIEELIKEVPGVEVFYLGQANSIESGLIAKSGFKFFPIRCGKLRRYFSWENFLDFFRFFIGIGDAFFLLRKIKPKLVFSKGGFVSLPVVIAAYFSRIGVFIHESDVRPGLANRIGFFFAKKIILSLEESKKYLRKNVQEKAVTLGAIVRPEILAGEAKAGLTFTKLNRFKKVILVMGGSLGAEQINSLLRTNLPLILKKYQVVHITGKGHLDIGINYEGYRQYEYLGAEMKDVYAISSLVISRGGAGSLAEIAALSKRAIIIPLGLEVSRGDQIENAEVYCKKYGWPLLQSPISGDNFVKSIDLAMSMEFPIQDKLMVANLEIVNLIKKNL